MQKNRFFENPWVVWPLNKIEDLHVYTSPVQFDHFPIILSLKNVQKKVDVAKKPFVKCRN